MQDLFFIDPVPPPVDFLTNGECDEDWLAPLGMVSNSKPVGIPAPDLRRVQSTPAMGQAFNPTPMGWGDKNLSSSPLPIRSTRCGPVDVNNSMDSAHTFLGASCPEDASLLMHHSGVNNSSLHGGNHYGSLPQLPRHTYTGSYNASLPVWVPEPQVNTMSARPVDFGSAPSSQFESLDLLDEAIAMITHDNISVPTNNPHQYGRHYHHQSVGGSCPLPTLLEASLMEDDDGSDRSHSGVLTGHLSSGSLSMDLDNFGSYMGGHDVRSTASPTRRAHSSPRNVPVARASHRTAMERTVRGGLPIHHSAPVAAHGLSSSYPYDTNRPLRTAARRSLAVTAAALREYDDGSETEIEDGPLYAEVSIRRGTNNGGKKKHNPWSLEETEALVTGVKMAGLGKWAEIKRLPVPAIADILANRSAVDLKDKWRNLTRVARLPKAQLKARLARSASEVPLDMMLTVKSLMESGSLAD